MGKIIDRIRRRQIHRRIKRLKEIATHFQPRPVVITNMLAVPTPDMYISTPRKSEKSWWQFWL